MAEDKMNAEQVREALFGIPVAKALEISEEDGKVIVRIPSDIFLSNEQFGQIHARITHMGGRYRVGDKSWEIS